MFSDTLSSKEVIRIKNSLADVWYTDNIKFSYFIYMEIYGCQKRELHFGYKEFMGRMKAKAVMTQGTLL